MWAATRAATEPFHLTAGLANRLPSRFGENHAVVYFDNTKFPCDCIFVAGVSVRRPSCSRIGKMAEGSGRRV